MPDIVEAAKIEAGAVVAERFRLERELGRGGMGSVWLAHHIPLDIPCAVKFIVDARVDDADGQARFTHEARAAAKLRSPNVVQILDHGIWGTFPYIAMELLEGETLTQRLNREGALSLAETSRIVSDVAHALTRAEELHIVHRDLKPDNLFIVKERDREIVKVLDFGVAKLSPEAGGSVRTASGVLIGTPHYMSPEQAHGAKDIDHRSDLWALAAVAFECATGKRPFDGTGLGEVMHAIMTAPLPSPSAILPSLPPELDAWWERAAARDVKARFQNARELASALRAISEDSALATTGPLHQENHERTSVPQTFDGSATIAPAPRFPQRALLVASMLVLSAGLLWYFVLRDGGAAPRRALSPASSSVSEVSEITSVPAAVAPKPIAAAFVPPTTSVKLKPRVGKPTPTKLQPGY